MCVCTEGSLDGLVPGRSLPPSRALFVCTRNSARSQLAAAMWRSITGAPADSAGTHPADSVHPGAVAAGKRAGLDLSGATPRAIGQIQQLPDLVVTVCDQAHEELAPDDTWLHWSITDPVAYGRPGRVRRRGRARFVTGSLGSSPTPRCRS